MRTDGQTNKAILIDALQGRAQTKLQLFALSKDRILLTRLKTIKF